MLLRILQQRCIKLYQNVINGIASFVQIAFPMNYVSVALIFLAFLPKTGFSQSLDELKKGTRIGDRIEILIQQSKEYTSHYAVGVEFTAQCESFFLVRDSLTEKIHLLAGCGEKRIHEEFSSLQSDEATSFQPENNSTWILKNTSEWVIFTLDMVRTKGWSPIKVSRKEVDSIYLLDRSHYLTITGNRKWHNYISENGDVISNEVFFEGTTFYPFFGGLIVPIKEQEKVVYRYIQYEQFTFWDDELQENVPDPNFTYLKPRGNFAADEVIAPPHSYNCVGVIRNNQKVQVYSFCHDKVLEDAINTYYTVDGYGIIALTDEYIVYGGEWKKVACKQPQRIEFEYFGDIVTANVFLKDGSKLTIEL